MTDICASSFPMPDRFKLAHGSRRCRAKRGGVRYAGRGAYNMSVGQSRTSGHETHTVDGIAGFFLFSPHGSPREPGPTNRVRHARWRWRGGRGVRRVCVARRGSRRSGQRRQAGARHVARVSRRRGLSDLLAAVGESRAICAGESGDEQRAARRDAAARIACRGRAGGAAFAAGIVVSERCEARSQLLALGGPFPTTARAWPPAHYRQHRAPAPPTRHPPTSYSAPGAAR